MFSKLRKRAQSTAEYAVLIALVVGAVVAMQVYVKRGIQGRIRDVVDDVSLGGTINSTGVLTGEQYEPYYAASTGSTTQSSDSVEDLNEDGSVTRNVGSQVDVTRNQTIGW